MSTYYAPYADCPFPPVRPTIVPFQAFAKSRATPTRVTQLPVWSFSIFSCRLSRLCQPAKPFKVLSSVSCFTSCTKIASRLPNVVCSNLAHAQYRRLAHIRDLLYASLWSGVWASETRDLPRGGTLPVHTFRKVIAKYVFAPSCLLQMRRSHYKTCPTMR